MKRITKAGNKTPKKEPLPSEGTSDIMYGFECDCGRQHYPTFEDLAWIQVGLIKNEDFLYPPSQGFRGGLMLQDYFTEAMIFREIPSKEKYQL